MQLPLCGSKDPGLVAWPIDLYLYYFEGEKNKVFNICPVCIFRVTDFDKINAIDL
jgi:hypothetical protein